jgi:hypothetical protein
MSDQKRLFLLDAYALIFRGYYAFIKNQGSIQRNGHFGHGLHEFVDGCYQRETGSFSGRF